MQQVTVQEQVEYASLGWRFAAVLVDTVVLFGLLIIAMMVYILVLAAQGRIDPQDPAAVQALSQDLGVSDLMANVVVFGALFVYYAVLEGIFGASVGKLVFRMRVVMADGSKPTGGAVIVRNLVRIPEAWLLYIPAGISCLASGRRQRLGDHAARTMVVRRRLAVAGGAPPSARRLRPLPRRRSTDSRSRRRPRPAAPGRLLRPLLAVATAPSVDEALAHLKTAALAARGAHLNYLRFSERELAAGTADPAAATRRSTSAPGSRSPTRWPRCAPPGTRRRPPPSRRDGRWTRPAPSRPTSPTSCASSRRTRAPRPTRRSTRRSWPSPAGRRRPDAARRWQPARPPREAGRWTFGVR